MTRPLPDSEAYADRQRRQRRRRVHRTVLIVLLLMTLGAIMYLLAGGELPDPPRWLETLLRGGGSEGSGGGP